MASRLNLHKELREVLGTNNVYFQPPASVSMKYDAIRYSLSGKDLQRANNKAYIKTNEYECVYITKNPDSSIPDDILDRFEMCSMGKPYVVDNLYHYPFTLYY